MGDPTVTVTPWKTQPNPEHLGAEYHDCLWEIALEQATLERMKGTGKDFNTAKKQVTPEEIQKHLDTICDDNGFRRLGGGGSGRNPNLIYDGEKIKVRIAPTKLTEVPAGVNSERTGTAYSKAVQSDTGNGTDVNKKEKLDIWTKSIPGFESLPEDLRVAWIEAYARAGVDPTKLTQLNGNAAFNKLTVPNKTQLLRTYGQKDQALATAEIDKLLAAPGEGANERMRLIATPGFAKLNNGQQKRLLERYDQDPNFKAAIDAIVKQENFTDRTDKAQGHALDILYRYAGRKGIGYGQREEPMRDDILLTLYNNVLSKPDFNLAADGGSGKPENSEQDKKIEDFAQNDAIYVQNDMQD